MTDMFLSPGDVIVKKYRVVELLGEGGFGIVYKVEDVKTKEQYAMKLESKDELDSMIKIEAIVLQMMARRQTLQHVCRFIDEGETAGYRLLVMQLLGRSLSELRKSSKNNRFSLSATIRLGMQSLEAIENLHRIGFLHRDIKPGNFAMGRKENEKRVVFMIDYGLCRQYITREGQIRPPRQVAGFRGTLRYASVNTHLRKELGRHDDLWSLYYMLIEMRSGELPWHKLDDLDEVMKKKRDTPISELLTSINEQEFTAMNDQLRKLTYYEAPNYGWFNQHLRTIAARNRYKDGDPFDWEPGGESYDTSSKATPKKGTRKKGGKRREKIPDDKDKTAPVQDGTKDKAKQSKEK